MKTELQEAQADIALNAGYLIATKQIDVSDSRELIDDIVKWPGIFVKLDPHTEWIATDYLEAIDLFAIEMLLETYGIDFQDEGAV
jgi:hypothetical protein